MFILGSVALFCQIGVSSLQKGGTVTMSAPRTPGQTMLFVDCYCAQYQDLFPDVRSFEHFKLLHLGLITEIPRKSLPAIANAVGLPNGQALHHFLADSPSRLWPFFSKPDSRENGSQIRALLKG